MNDEYKTRDLGVAAFIVAHGEVIKKMTMDNGIIYFIFDGVDRCSELEDDYKFNNGTVIGRLFFEALRQVKGRMYELKGEPYGR